jgi:hypothetical protein
LLNIAFKSDIKMILIYCEKITKRLDYTFSLIFEGILQWNYKLTTDKRAFLSYPDPKISYAYKTLNNSPFIASRDLLFESHISHQEINYVEQNGIKCPFATHNENSLLNFDLFAASFYLVSRYEEYLPHKKDKHKRYLASESIAYQNSFLRKPVVNIWAHWLKDLLLAHYTDLPKLQESFKFIPTYDIDIAWSYKNKDFTRTIGGFVKSLFRFNLKEASERISVFLERKKDPFDTYELQKKYAKKYNLKPIYFFHVGNLGPFDRSISIKNKNYQKLIKDLNDFYTIGIHPSYQSNFESKILKSEIYNLRSLIHKEIINSRQHFLMVSIPKTYRDLQNHGIMHDYTMGYAEEVGFRAGICTPFFFYDLESETNSNLRIHPFAVMDGTLRDYMQKSISESKEILSELVDEVKKINGVFISIWHNESLSNQEKWIGWNEVYEHLLKLVTK